MVTEHDLSLLNDINRQVGELTVSTKILCIEIKDLQDEVEKLKDRVTKEEVSSTIAERVVAILFGLASAVAGYFVGKI